MIIGGWASSANRAGQGGALQRMRTGLGSRARSWLQPFINPPAEGGLPRVVEAHEHLSQALALGSQTGEHWWEVVTFGGQLLLHENRSNRVSAAERFEEAARADAGCQSP